MDTIHINNILETHLQYQCRWYQFLHTYYSLMLVYWQWVNKINYKRLAFITYCIFKRRCCGFYCDISAALLFIGESIVKWFHRKIHSRRCDNQQSFLFWRTLNEGGWFISYDCVLLPVKMNIQQYLFQTHNYEFEPN